jgi:uncharacterized protein (TIGR00369 family)
MTYERTGMQILKDAGVSAKLHPSEQLLGWRLLEIEEGRVKAEFEGRPEFLNPAGAVHGGLLAAMLDEVMGAAAFSTAEPGRHTVTLEIKVQYVRPGRPGKFTAEAKLVHRTKSIAFAEGELKDANGDLVATGSATLRYVSRAE